MPNDLTGQPIASTYGQILHVDGGVTSTPKVVNDGDGTATALKVATTSTASVGDHTIEAGNKLKLADNDSSHSIALKAPAVVTADVTLTLPATAGTNGQALVTDGSGNLAWAALGGGLAGVLDTQTFNSSGTWTKPASGRVAVIRAWGGGGSGSKGLASAPGGGGGGGGFIETIYALSDLPSTVSVTVGGGGAAITGTGGVAGNAGGQTSFGTYAYAGGGGAGAYDTAGGGGGGGGGGSRTSATGINGANGSIIYPDRAAGGSGSNSTLAVYSIFDGITNLDPSLPASTQSWGANTYTTAFAGDGAAGGNARAQTNGVTAPGSSSTSGSGTGFGGGGGGGGMDVSNSANATDARGGNSLWGGGGGGGAGNGTAAGNAGTSTYGGNGGAGAFDANVGGNGIAPGGGGGGTEGGNSGGGAAGRVIVYVF